MTLEWLISLDSCNFSNLFHYHWSMPEQEWLVNGQFQMPDLDSNPTHHLSPAKKMKWLIFELRSLLVIGQLQCRFATPIQSFPTKVAQNDLEWPILPDLQLFQPGWLMDSNPICHPGSSQWNWNANFTRLHSTFPIDGLESHLQPLTPANEMKWLISLDSQLFNLLLIGQAGSNGLRPHGHPSMFTWIVFNFSDDLDSSKKVDSEWKKWKRSPKSFNNQMFIFALRSTSDVMAKQSEQIWWPKHINKQYKKGPLKCHGKK